MNLGGWILLTISWSLIIGLAAGCFYVMIKKGKL